MKTLLFELTINRGSAARVSIGRVLSIDTTEIIRVEFIEFRKIDECVNCSVDLSYEIWKKKEKRKKEVSFLTKEFLRNRFLRVIRCRVTNANGPR